LLRVDILQPSVRYVMDISFSERASWNGDRDCIVFHASFGKKTFRCVVSYNFLAAPRSDYPTEEEALRLFMARRSQIESTIRDRIEKNVIEKGADGVDEIALRSGDATMI
jgi:hypothetical protein